MVTTAKLLGILTDQTKRALLEVELAAAVDYGRPTTYKLEGDGPLVLADRKSSSCLVILPVLMPLSESCVLVLPMLAGVYSLALITSNAKSAQV